MTTTDKKLISLASEFLDEGKFPNLEIEFIIDEKDEINPLSVHIKNKKSDESFDINIDTSTSSFTSVYKKEMMCFDSAWKTLHFFDRCDRLDMLTTDDVKVLNEFMPDFFKKVSLSFYDVPTKLIPIFRKLGGNI